MSSHALDRQLVTLKSPASFAAEQYQGLRLTVERLRALRDVRVVAVTSPAAGDGKTVTAINLAGALGHGSKTRVLLIDADLRRPAVASRLGITGMETHGLVDAISDATMQFEDVTQRVNGYNLAVMPAGSVDAPVHEILRSDRLERMLQDARQQYDFIVLDTPPLLPVFDAALLSRLVDGVIVVVAANRTPRKLVAEALNVLDPSKVIGIVFNGDARPLFGYYHSSYRQYFREHARQK
jgi:protein-tyrosine kinase